MQISFDTNNMTDLDRKLLALITEHRATVARIAPEDNPATGTEVATVAPLSTPTPVATPVLESLDPNVAFGSATPSGDVHFTAHSTVDADRPPIAQIISPIAPNAGITPAPTFSAPANAPVATSNASLLNLVQNVIGDVDKNGFAWNAEIHSSSKAKNADGTWRYRRGVDPAVVTHIESQLRMAASAPAVPSFQPAIQTIEQPIVANEQTAPAQTGGIWTFPTVIARIAELQASGRTNQEKIQQVLTQLGIPNIAMIAARGDLFPAFISMVESGV